MCNRDLDYLYHSSRKMPQSSPHARIRARCSACMHYCYRQDYKLSMPYHCLQGGKPKCQPSLLSKYIYPCSIVSYQRSIITTKHEHDAKKSLVILGSSGYSTIRHFDLVHVKIRVPVRLLRVVIAPVSDRVRLPDGLLETRIAYFTASDANPEDCSPRI